MRTAREEELMIEVERLKAWLHKIKIEAWKDNADALVRIERMAEQAVAHGSCVCQPDWEPSEQWASLGLWPN
jgi:hypothetical protein